MSKLNSKQAVVEWYWPDFLKYVMSKRSYAQKYDLAANVPATTLSEFWKWYITEGPMGVKEAGRYYTKEEIEYV